MSEEIKEDKDKIHNGIDFLKPDTILKPITKRVVAEFKKFDYLKEGTINTYKKTIIAMHYYYTGVRLTDNDLGCLDEPLVAPRESQPLHGFSHGW